MHGHERNSVDGEADQEAQGEVRNGQPVGEAQTDHHGQTEHDDDQSNSDCGGDARGALHECRGHEDQGGRQEFRGGQDQYLSCRKMHQNPTDTRTLIPHLEGFKKAYRFLPEELTADAGYGSEENYQYLKTQGIELQALGYQSPRNARAAKQLTIR